MKSTLHYSIMISVLLPVLFLGGCGRGGKEDSPGITASASITPSYNGASTYSVDSVRNSCSNGSTTQLEYFADHGATVSFSASLINPSNLIKQMTVFIDSYTITYNSHDDSSGAPSLQPDTRQMTFSFIVNGATPTASASVAIAFVDLIRKERYYSVAGGGLSNYTATYTFSGHTEHGDQFTITSQTDFQIGGFNYCPSGFNPI